MGNEAEKLENDSTAEAEVVQETSEETTEDTSVNWQDFLDDEATEEVVEGEEKVDKEVEETPAAEEPPVKEVEETPKSEEPEKEEQPPTEEVVEEVAEAPAVDDKTQTPEEQEEVRKQAREELTKHFALDEKDVERFQDNPGEVLPELAADLYLQVYENVVNGIVAALPRMIEGVQNQQRAVASAEDQFYGKWKQLNTAEGKAQVKRLGNFYRQANPNATLEEFIQDVGLQASIALKLPIEGYAGTEETPPAAPVTPPSAPPASASRPAAGVATPSNPFTALAEEFEEEER